VQVWGGDCKLAFITIAIHHPDLCISIMIIDVDMTDVDIPRVIHYMTLFIAIS
jgi:hypothetical protein